MSFDVPKKQYNVTPTNEVLFFYRVLKLLKYYTECSSLTIIHTEGQGLQF